MREFVLSVNRVCIVVPLTVIEVVEVKEWTEHDQREDAHRIAEKRTAERLEAEAEEARLLEQHGGDVRPDKRTYPSTIHFVILI
jgi:hypothetical protein